ncbi:MAG: FAD-dependent oxidoreductase, partial [Pseudomonadota bacterium]
MRFSGLKILTEGLTGNKGWGPHWRSPEPKPEYDIVLIGGGGHGLATAYYLASVHGMTRIAIIEKGWLGGGNVGRNTTIVRANYMLPGNERFYSLSLKLWEGLTAELNYNVMFSPRGVMMLAQTEHEVRGYQRTAHANSLQGVQTEFIGPDRVKELCPIIETRGPRYPVLGALWQARGGTARHD